MIVEPKVKGFICTTAHPAGCKESVRRQIAYCKEKGMVEGPKKVLVIGSSTGYGLASRIAVTYGYGADTIGVAFERESNGRRTATAGSVGHHGYAHMRRHPEVMRALHVRSGTAYQQGKNRQHGNSRSRKDAKHGHSVSTSQHQIKEIDAPGEEEEHL